MTSLAPPSACLPHAKRVSGPINAASAAGGPAANLARGAAPIPKPVKSLPTVPPAVLAKAGASIPAELTALLLALVGPVICVAVLWVFSRMPLS